MNTVYVKHPAVNGGVETQLDGVRLCGTLGSSITMTVPPAAYGTMTAIFNAQGPRTSTMTLRVVRDTDQAIGNWIVAESRRRSDGGADLILRATGPIVEGPGERTTAT